MDNHHANLATLDNYHKTLEVQLRKHINKEAANHMHINIGVDHTSKERNQKKHAIRNKIDPQRCSCALKGEERCGNEASRKI